MSASTAVGWKGLPTFVLSECGVCVDLDGLVTIPYRLPHGGLYAERVVAPNGRRWWRPGDGRAVIPFGLDRLADSRARKYRVLVITEGESDYLAVFASCAHLGVDVLGLPGAGTWRARWRRFLFDAGTEPYAAVYVCGDGDDSGRRMTTAVVADVPEASAIWLPDGQDVRGLIQSQGADPFLALLGEADAFAEVFGHQEVLADAA